MFDANLLHICLFPSSRMMVPFPLTMNVLTQFTIPSSANILDLARVDLMWQLNGNYLLLPYALHLFLLFYLFMHAKLSI